MGSQSLSTGMNSVSRFLRNGFGWLGGLSSLGIWKRKVRQLRISETISMGNRGYLAVVEYQKQQFLVGGTNTSMALLAQLSAPVRAEESFAAALESEK